MDYHGIEVNTTQECQASTQLVQVFAKNGTANLDNGKLLGLNRGEELQVLLALPPAANAVDGLRNNLPGPIAARQRSEGFGCREGSVDVEGSERSRSGSLGIGASDAGSDTSGTSAEGSRSGGKHVA